MLTHSEVSLTACLLATATFSLFCISHTLQFIAEVSYCKALYNDMSLVCSKKNYKDTPYPCMGSRARSHVHPTGMRACLPAHNFHEGQRSQGELQNWTVFHPSSHITTPPFGFLERLVRMRVTFDLSVFGSKFEFAHGPQHIWSYFSSMNLELLRKLHVILFTCNTNSLQVCKLVSSVICIAFPETVDQSYPEVR